MKEYFFFPLGLAALSSLHYTRDIMEKIEREDSIAIPNRTEITV